MLTMAGHDFIQISNEKLGRVFSLLEHVRKLILRSKINFNFTKQQ